MGLKVVAALLIASFSCASAQQACGSNGVACIGLPHACINGADTSKCDVVAKVSPSSASPNSVRIELSGVPNGPQKLGSPAITSRWVAVGFSENGMMPKSSVVHCFEQKGQAVSKLTWNIPDGNLNIGFDGVDQSPLSVVKTSLDGSGIQCTVDLKKQFTNSGTPVDLSKKYFLIAATGPLLSDSLSVHDFAPESSAPTSFSF
ncbi:uncharacterized protein LOC129597050 [Paramacrobiotus metropolitanus]|uniref:uncharacterized protein LOC129597050 n=1 Tax=Paramacrobiotus metropolitanus TaxID=2943436 RepID=UPI0024464308|nr:uncharacterized protein LOC129597050 [Paramacrobiotus metropolitanus]